MIALLLAILIFGSGFVVGELIIWLWFRSENRRLTRLAGKALAFAAQQQEQYEEMVQRQQEKYEEILQLYLDMLYKPELEFSEQEDEQWPEYLR